MSLKKYLKRASKANKGQNILEFALLTAIAIVALLSSGFLTNLRNPSNAFSQHFQATASHIAPEVSW